MQIIISFITALFLMCTSFITALPHTLMLDSQTPEQTITDVEEVLALYQEIAAQNEDIRLLHMNKYESPGLKYRLANLVYCIFVGTIWPGMPGSPEKLTADDLAGATAEYYREGKTLVISLVPDLDENYGAAGDRLIGNPYGYVAIYSARYVQPSHARIVVDTESGKIVAADYVLTVEMWNVNPVRINPIVEKRIYKLP